MDMRTKHGRIALGLWTASLVAGAITIFTLPATLFASQTGQRQLPGEELEQLLEARETVWRSWFENDQAGLKAALPEETLAINAAAEEWEDRDAILASAREFSRGGGRLVRLEFARTEHQAFGDVVILYSIYQFEVDNEGERSLSSGRATEIFVKRNGRWLNPGWHMDSGR